MFSWRGFTEAVRPLPRAPAAARRVVAGDSARSPAGGAAPGRRRRPGSRSLSAACRDRPGCSPGRRCPVGAAWTELAGDVRRRASTAPTATPPRCPAEAAGGRPAAHRRRPGLPAARRPAGLHPAPGAAGRAAAADVFSVPVSMLGDRRRPGGSSRSPPPASWRCCSSRRTSRSPAGAARSSGTAAGRRRARSACGPAPCAPPPARSAASPPPSPSCVPVADPDPRACSVFDFGPGSGGDGDISIENPMADLRRDLQRGDGHRRCSRSTTDDPDPSYLRIAVLNRFSDDEWSSGRPRRARASNLADGDDAAAARASTRRSSARRSTTTHVEATDDVRLDLAADPAPDQPDRGRRRLALRRWPPWTSSPATTTSTPPASTARSPRSSSTSTPTSWPGAGAASALVSDGVHRAARRPRRRWCATWPSRSPRSAPTRFEKARRAAELVPRGRAASPTTSTATEGNGADDLVAFLARGRGRPRPATASSSPSAMAVMARMLGIPARVAVGFLAPGPGRPRHLRSTAPTTCTPGPSSTSPAPAGCASSRRPPAAAPSGVPDYTTEHGHRRHRRPRPDRPTPPSEDHPEPRPTPRRSRRTPRPRTPTGGRRRAGVPVAAGARRAAALGAAGRCRRRSRPRDGAPPPPRQRRSAAARGGLGRAARHRASTSGCPGRASAHRGRPATSWCATSARRSTSTPPSARAAGREVNPDAVAALDRLVHALELLRYARARPAPAGDLARRRSRPASPRWTAARPRAPGAGPTGGRGRCSRRGSRGRRTSAARAGVAQGERRRPRRA